VSGILYISYDGMLEPLGQSQVLAYLERLASDFTVHLVSFEKAEDWNKMHLRSLVSARMRTAGISWHPLRYHKAPSALATAYDIAQGIRVSTALVRRHRLTVIHARSYVPSVMALAEVVVADHADVPRLMSRMHAGLVLIKPVYPKTASAPTKLGEFSDAASLAW